MRSVEINPIARTVFVSLYAAVRTDQEAIPGQGAQLLPHGVERFIAVGWRNASARSLRAAGGCFVPDLFFSAGRAEPVPGLSC